MITFQWHKFYDANDISEWTNIIFDNNNEVSQTGNIV